MTAPDRTPAGRRTTGAATARALPAVPPSALVEGVDVDALADAVRACPSVVRLTGGPLDSAATYLPGRRVAGVVVRRDPGTGLQVQVHVVARYGPTMATVAEQVRAVATAHAPGARTHVSIDDIDINTDTGTRTPS